MMVYRPRKAVALALALGAILIAAALALAGCSAADVDEDLAPDFSGVTLDGTQVSLSDFRGKPVVVVFMASWCGPCREESPEIDQFYKDNQDRAMLLAVDVSDTEEDIRAFMADNGLSFPLMLDGDSAANAYGVTAIPTTVIIDAEGRIAQRLIGGTTAAKLSLVIDGLTR